MAEAQPCSRACPTYGLLLTFHVKNKSQLLCASGARSVSWAKTYLSRIIRSATENTLLK